MFHLKIFRIKFPFLECREAHRELYQRKQPPEVFYKKAILKNFVIFTGKHLCWSLFFNKLKKETPAQVFPCEY